MAHHVVCLSKGSWCILSTDGLSVAVINNCKISHDIQKLNLTMMFHISPFKYKLCVDKYYVKSISELLTPSWTANNEIAMIEPNQPSVFHYYMFRLLSLNYYLNYLINHHIKF
jgi:hypothetical protein